MKNKKTVLVCVTPQESSQILVKSGKMIAEKNSADLVVVSVLPSAQGENPYEPQIVEKIYQTARYEGGEMSLFFSDDPILTLTAYIAKVKPVTIVTGFPGEKSNDFIATVHMLLPELNISMVDKDGTVYNILPCESEKVNA